MNTLSKNGESVVVNFDSKTQTATVNGRVIAGIRNNQPKLWNSDILSDAGNKMVKEAMQQRFCKKAVEGKKRK